jgi:flagellar assembly protein FliH
MPQPFPFARDFDAAPPMPAAKRAADAEAAEQQAARRQAALARARAELEQKLAAARQEGLEEGLARGRAEGRTEAEQDLAGEASRLAQALADAVPALRAAIDEQVARVAAEAGGFVAQAVAKLLPGLEVLLGPLRLERFVADALRSAPRASGITLKVAPDVAPRAAAALARLAPDLGAAAPVAIRPDPALSPGALQVMWEQGGIAMTPKHLSDSILDACRTLLGGALPVAEPTTPEHAAPGPATSPARGRPRRRALSPPPAEANLETQP